MMHKPNPVALALLVACAGRASAQTAPGPGAAGRCGLAVNGSYRTNSHSFENTLSLPLYGETETVATSYPVPAAPAVDVDVECGIRGRLGFRVGLTSYSRSGPKTLNAGVPHPLLFNQARTVTGETGALKRAELGVEFNAVAAVPVNDRVRIAIFGGPALMGVTQGLVTGLNVTSTYPFDQATFDSAPSSEQTQWKIGYDAGVDVTVMLTRIVGVGSTVQYLRGSASLSTADGKGLDVTLGGLQVGAGVRLRF